MGGTLWAENRKEGGATFGFSLRFEKGAVAEIQEETLHLSAQIVPEETDAGEESPENATSGNQDSLEDSGKNERMKILVVDDCEDTCRLIAKFLEQGPYDIDVANDGVAALEKYDGGKYELILMDIQLPRLDGVGATMEIRDKESGKKIPKTPIFALVGDPGEEDEGYHLAGDFDHCLIKPVSKDDLLEAISKLHSSR